MSVASNVLTAASNFHGTAVFLGGTSGVGQALAKFVTQHASQPCRIVIVGRNQQAATQTFEDMRANAKAQHEYIFESCDATLLSNVRKTTASLSSKLDKIDIIVASCGYLTTQGRDESSEGIDKKMALNLYSRMLFIKELTPLLEKAESPRVVSVLDAKRGPGKLDYDDLELKNTFGLAKCAKHTTTMTNVVFEDMADKYPKIGFAHVYPGLVATGITSNFSWPLRAASNIFMKVAGIAAEQCADNLSPALFDQKYAKGFWPLDDKAKQVPHGPETGVQARSKVMAHLEQMWKRG